MTDLDVGDPLTASISGTPTLVWSGGALTAGQITALTAALVTGKLTFTSGVLSDGGAQTIGYSYDATAANLDFLKTGDTLTIGYQVQVSDGQLTTVTQPLNFVITGTEDAPALAAITQPASVAELTNAAAQDLAPIAGTLPVTDLDVGDPLTASISGTPTLVWSGGALTAGQITALTAALVTGKLTFTSGVLSDGGAQTIGYSYDATAANLDFLKTGDTLTIGYQVQVSDGQLTTVTQPLNFVITGTEDAPALAAITQPASVAELTNAAAQDLAPIAGTLPVTDLDVGDPLTASISGTPTLVWSGGALTAGQITALTAALVTGKLTFTSGVLSDGGAQTIGYSYDATAANLDFLKTGDTLTIGYQVQVSDGQLTTVTQPLNFVITGTEDAPALAAITQPASVAELTNAAAQDLAPIAGTLPVTDLDVGDPLTASISGTPTLVWSGGALTAGQITALTAALVTGKLTFTSGVLSDGGAQTIGYSYDATAANLDFLKTGDTLTIGYQVQVSDGQLTTVTQPLNFVITGTNDPPAAATFTPDASSGNPDPDNDSDPSGAHIDETAVIGQFAAVDPEGDAITYSLGSGSASGFSLNSSGKLAVGNSDVGAGTYTLNIRATDSHGAATTTPITIWVGGTSNDTPALSSITNTIIAYGLDGNDTIVTGSGNDVLIGGRGSDTMTGGGGTDTFNFTAGAGASFAGDSLLTIGGSGTSGTIAGYDTITDYTPAATALASEKIGFSGVSVSGGIAGSTPSTLQLHTASAVTSASVSNGIVTFNGGTSLTTLADVAAAVQFLQANDIGTTGSSLAFSATISGITHTFLFIQGSVNSAAANNVNDVLIDLPHVSATSLSTSGLSNQLAVIGALAPAGVAGDPINLALTDLSGGQSGPVTVTVTGAPSDWSMDQGTNLGAGAWAVQTSDPAALTIRTPAIFAGAALLNVTESWTNADGSTGTASLKDNVEAYAAGSPIFAWSGNDTLTGAGANNLFVFAQPIGNDTIYNFNAGSDKIDLIGFNNVASFSDIQAHLTDDASGNAVITIGSDESITVHGVSAAALTANNFVFDQTPVTNNAGMMTIGDNAMLPLSGIINNTGTIALDSAANTTTLELIQNGITLQGGGHVILSDSDANVISGAFPGITLTNVDNTISGAGQLGDWQTVLVNEGTIVATGTHALTIDTGSNAVINSGTLEATGSGGLIVNGDISNAGLIWADGGNITIGGAVTGTGSALISGAATFEFVAASSANVTFAGDNFGTLALDHPTDYTGQIFGFTGTSPQSSDAIDLKGIAFDAGTSWTYFDNAGSDTGGALTVSETINGTATAVDTLTFANGDYATANFILKSDGSGGTLIVDPPADSGRAMIDSGAPAPILTTGPANAPAGGNDTFVFKATTDSQSGAGNFDTINNFTHGSDHLDFTAIALANNVQQTAVDAAGLVDPHSISWFVDTAHNQTIVYVNTTDAANTVSMEVHLSGSNVNLAGSDILHHT